jgi:TPR repeat protein
MQSKTDDILAELKSSVPTEYHERCFKLFEEYSDRHIAETIRNRRETYEKAGSQARKEIEAKANTEIAGFRTWLESAKKFTPQAAYYHSVSLKSLLIGIPAGVQIAQLFSAILENI